MAMKALRCPQCGSELELDDSKDFGFCSSCGTKIMLHETVEMKHTGAVNMRMDNSNQGNNRIALGNRAFEAGNYEEAYKYFTQGLEDVPNNITALYRKGICAAYLSPKNDIRVRELIVGLEAAFDTYNEIHDSADGREDVVEELLNQMESYDDDLEKLGKITLENHEDYYYKCKNLATAENQAACWSEAALLLQVVSSYLVDDEKQEAMLVASIEKCDEWLKIDNSRKISYYVNTTTNKNGKSTDNYSVYRMPDAYRNTIEEARRDMADTFNNMASRKEREASIRNDVDALTQEKTRLADMRNAAEAEFNAAKDAFWSANPELCAIRDKKKNLSWISVGVGAVIFIVSFFMRNSSGIIAPIIGAAAFVGSFFLKSTISARAIASLEEKYFTDDVKALGDAFLKAQSNFNDKAMELKEKEHALSSFEATKK